MSETTETRRPRPMWMRFLAVNTPLVIVFAVLIYGVFEIHTLNLSRDKMSLKLDRFAEDQSRVLSSAVWTLDRERVSVILDAVVNEPDVVAARVLDNFGEEIASVGAFDRADKGLIRKEEIAFRDGNQFRIVGELTIAASEERLVSEITNRVLRNLVLLMFLLAAAIISAAIAFRRTIGTPLHKLVAALESDDGRSMERVEWDSDDEIGEVIAAFNRMRQRQRRFQRELREAREDLERRVEQRTYELAVARDEAEAANNAKSRFLANMSHELRTPLNAVIGFAEVMINEMFGPLGDRRYKGYSEDIRKSGEHLLALINDILDLSKVEAGKWDMTDEPVCLKETVSEAMRLVAPGDTKEGAGKLEIRADIDEDIPKILADSRAIMQVLVNLLSNAIKFTPRPGEITTRVRRSDDGGVRISVTDTGIGIPADQIDNVIKPFSQGDTSMARVAQGTGLGLSLVNVFMELHGGTVDIDSTEGVGTSVSIQFPPSRVIDGNLYDVTERAEAAGE